MNLHKTLLILLALANILGVTLVWGLNNISLLGASLADTIIALGRLAGLWLALGTIMQVVLTTRIAWIERAFGLDKLARLHHWTGYGVVVLLILHPLFITSSYATFSQTGFLQQFLTFITSSNDLFRAFLAALLIILVGATSVYIARRHFPYEGWYAIHLSGYIAILLAFGHQLELGDDLLTSPVFAFYWRALYFFLAGNVIYYRIIRPALLWRRHQFRLEKIVPETAEANSLYITGRSLDHFRIQAGQFLTVRFLTKKLWWQSHPFSLSCAPNGKHLRITVKKLGDFTRQLESIPPGTAIVVDGPFGKFTEDSAEQPKTLLIAGGIGITPLRALSETMTDNGKDVLLLYGNRREQDIVFKRELESLTKTKADKLKVVHVLSEEATYPGEKGVINAERLQRLVPDYQDRDIFICGPIPMIDALYRTFRQLGLPRHRLHFEKFAL